MNLYLRASEVSFLVPRWWPTWAFFCSTTRWLGSTTSGASRCHISGRGTASGEMGVEGEAEQMVILTDGQKMAEASTRVAIARKRLGSAFRPLCAARVCAAGGFPRCRAATSTSWMGASLQMGGRPVPQLKILAVVVLRLRLF